ncbi:hypothetical protein HPB47_018107 [Ixodes persulcatus]|uniref:Uncharacterized protein n=1 Tax=Ixodes persulcatus TaxID=34615 RepID=A0AC60QLS6_IXOPE|nr:hypothetical protein HPB47_018107 [Ixodes persulcatus]
MDNPPTDHDCPGNANQYPPSPDSDLGPVLTPDPGHDPDSGSNRAKPFKTSRPDDQRPPNSNPLLNSDITVPEVRVALLQLHTNSAPGPDQSTNKALRNLDDQGDFR